MNIFAVTVVWIQMYLLAFYWKPTRTGRFWDFFSLYIEILYVEVLIFSKKHLQQKQSRQSVNQ